MPCFASLAEDALGIGKSRIPGIDLGHLRTDMERHAVGLEAHLVRVDEHIDGHLRHAAELAGKRPFGAFAVGQHAAEHLRAGSGAGNLLDFLMAADGIKADAEREGTSDVTFLLDRVAEGDAVCRSAGIECHLDFGDRGAVEVGTHRSEQLQDCRFRVGLDRVIDRAVRQGMTEGLEIVAHDVEIHDKKRSFGTLGLDEVKDTSSGHRSVPSKSQSSGYEPEDKGRMRMRSAQLVETPEP